MKQLAVLLALFTLCLPASATWTLVQIKTGTGAGTSSTCAVTMTSTGASHAITVGSATGGVTQRTISSVSGAGTYTLCGATCQTGNSTAGWVDGAYTLASTSGTTTITLTMSGTSTDPTCFAAEWSDTTTFAFDAGNSILDSVNCTSCAAPTVTLGGSNDAIFSISSCGQTCSGAITNYTTVYNGTSADGGAGRINTNTSAFNWAQAPTGQLSSMTIALKETGGGSTYVPQIGGFVVGP